MPFAAMGGAVHGCGDAIVIVGQLAQAGAFGTERPFIDRMVGISFDVDDLPCAGFAGAADDPATHGTITADTGGFLAMVDF